MLYVVIAIQVIVSILSFFFGMYTHQGGHELGNAKIRRAGTIWMSLTILAALGMTVGMITVFQASNLI